MKPGPNDLHYALVGGVLTQQPGLGADQPTDEAMFDMARNSAAEKARLEALAKIKEGLTEQAVALDTREADLNARLAAVEARERALAPPADEIDADAFAGAAKRRTGARQSAE